MKKMKLLSLRSLEGTSVAEYQARFLVLERFASGSFSPQRVRASPFVFGLHICLHVVVATFSCSTLVEAVIRALECDHTHDSHH